MSTAKASDAEVRRAYRRDLRMVSRLLRGAGLVLAAIGVGGLLTGARGDWWTTPSWASLALGLGLLAASVVQRVRRRRERSDLPEG